MRIGLCTALTVAFVILKLLGKIAWSWWWVLAPTWIPLVIGLTILGVVACLAILLK